ncbi:MAG: hypothetical protein GX559_01765 [Candidatus Pacebacteria bacterium]|nr:hypothetical protein [Candidatus Paceibacterota bacterium]
MQKQISINQAIEHFSILKKLPISRAWRGYGSSIFFEFGKIDDKGAGDYTLAVSNNWWLKSSALSLDAGSSFSEIDNFLQKLMSMSLQDVSVVDDKLLFTFDNCELKIILNSMENNGWSLNKIEEAFLTTSGGSFILEKED